MTARMTEFNPAAGQVVLKPRKSGPFFARHPWVLDASVQNVVGEPSDGAVVDLMTDKGQFVARGIYNSQSRIRVRLYSWSANTPLDDAFWRQRLESALSLRRQLGYTATDDACRLVFSEADALSGLIVDRYGQDLVIQLTARAMAERLDSLLALLVELANPRGILVRTDRQIAQTEGFQPRDGRALGPAGGGNDDDSAARRDLSRSISAKAKRPGFISTSAKTGSPPLAISRAAACSTCAAIAALSA